MKHSAKLTALATMLILAALQTNADQTNLVRSLDIKLTGFKQGSTTTTRNVTTTTVDDVSVVTGDVIQAIGAAMGASFSTAAQLVLITPLNGGWSSVAIRDAGNSTDVSSFLGLGELSAEVISSTVNTKTGKYTSTARSIEQFVLFDADGYLPLTLHYNLSGLTTDEFSNTAKTGPSGALNAHVSGTGDSDGVPLILHGTIKAQGDTIEVVTGGGGPPA